MLACARARVALTVQNVTKCTNLSVYVIVLATLEVDTHVALGSGKQAALPAGIGAPQGGHQWQRPRPASAPRSHWPERSSLHLRQP